MKFGVGREKASILFLKMLDSNIVFVDTIQDFEHLHFRIMYKGMFTQLEFPQTVSSNRKMFRYNLLLVEYTVGKCNVKDTYRLIRLKSIAVSVVVMVLPSKMPACRSHRSIWDRVMWEPSLCLSLPNKAKSSNCGLKSEVCAEYSRLWGDPAPLMNELVRLLGRFIVSLMAFWNTQSSDLAIWKLLNFYYKNQTKVK